MGEAKDKAAEREAMRAAEHVMITFAMSMLHLAALVSAGETILELAKRQGRDGYAQYRALADAVALMQGYLDACNMAATEPQGNA